MIKQLLRKASLERFASPEQIDRLLVIVRVPGWIALGCILVITAIVIIWSLTGWIPISVSGVGVFFNPRDIMTVNSNVAGFVTKVEVNVGDEVKEGTLLCSLTNPNMIMEREELKKKIARVQSELSFHQKKEQERLKLSLELQKSLLKIQEMKLGFLNTTLTSQSKNLPAFIEVQQSSYDVQMAVEKQKNAIALIEDRLLSQEHLPLLVSLGSNLSELNDSLEILENQIKNFSISAPTDGTVMEINVLIGESVLPGTNMMWFERASSPRKEHLVYSFFSREQGVEVKSGMIAHIAFQGIDVNRYGKMVGKVKQVLPFAATREGMVLQSIPSKKIRDYLTQQPTTVLIEIEPLPNSRNPTGYEWTASEGPPSPIPKGSIANVTIIIQERHPIYHFLPMGRS